MRLFVVEDLAFLVSRLSRSGALALVWGPMGSVVAEMDLRVRKERHQREERNLLHFRPELSRSEARSFVRGLTKAKWRAWGSRVREQASNEVKGLEHLHGALALGKGVILWESPFGTR